MKRKMMLRTWMLMLMGKVSRYSVNNSQSTDSLSKPDTSDILVSSCTRLRFTAGVLSSSPSLDPPPSCAPEVVLKSPPMWRRGRRKPEYWGVALYFHHDNWQQTVFLSMCISTS